MTPATVATAKKTRLSGRPHARRLGLALGALGALGALLALAACGTGARHPLARVTPPPSPGTLYTSGGALRAADGATLWTQDAGQVPAILGQTALFTEVVDPPHYLLAVHALSVSNGALLWTAQPTGCCGPLALAGDNLLAPLFQSTSGGADDGAGQITIAALGATDGHLVWRSDAIPAFVTPQLDGPSPFVSPLATANHVVVAVVATASNTTLVAAWKLDSGKLAWHASLQGRADYSAPAIAITPNGAVVTVEYGNQSEVASFDLATGKSVWQRALGNSEALDLTSNSLDVLSDAATGAITGLRPSDGATLWQVNIGPSGQKDYVPYFIAANDSVIVYRGFPSDCTGTGMDVSCIPRLSAINLATGSVRWQRALDTTNPEFAVRGGANDSALYYQFFTPQSGESQFSLMALDLSDGHVDWRRVVDGMNGPFVVTDAAVFATVQGQKGATCPISIESFSVSDGATLWTRDYPACATALIPRGGWIMLG